MRSTLFPISAVAVAALVPCAVAAADVRLDAFLAGKSGTVNLNPADRYIGGAQLTSDLNIVGNGATIDLDAAAAPFQTIRVSGAGTQVTISDCRIQDGPSGNVFAVQGATVSLFDVTSAATGNGRGAVAETGGFVEVVGGSLTGGNVALDLLPGTSAAAEDVAISGNGAFVIFVQNGSTLSLDGCTVSGTAPTMIGGDAATVSLSNVSINAANNTAVGFGNNSTIVAEGMDIRNSTGRGFYLFGGTATLSDIRVSTTGNFGESENFVGNTHPITLIGSASATIDGFLARGAQFPLEVYDATGAVTIAGVDFRGMPNGVRIANCAQPILARDCFFRSIQDNAFNIEGSTVTVRDSRWELCPNLCVTAFANSNLTVANLDMVDSASTPPGVGINTTDATLAIVEPVRIVNNATTLGGGGIKITRTQGGTMARGCIVIGYALGIHLLDNSSMNIPGARIERSGEAIYIDTSTTVVEDCIIRDNRIGQGLQAERFSNITFRRNQVYGSAESGVGIDSSGFITVADNYFSDQTFGGISISPAAASPVARVYRNTTRRPGVPAGLYCLADNATFSQNFILSARTYGMHDLGNNNTFERNFVVDAALEAANMSPDATQVLRGNVFFDCTYGLLLSTGQIVLDGNVFERIGTVGEIVFAFFAAGSARTTYCRDNWFTSLSEDGMWISDTNPPNPGAQQNWWGDPSGPNQGGFLGPGTGSSVTNANFNPWLTEAPASFGFVDNIELGWNAARTVSYDTAPGLRAILFSQTPLREMGSAMLARKSNPTGTPPANCFVEGTPRAYVSTWQDARLVAPGGRSAAEVDLAVLTSRGVSDSGEIFAATFDDAVGAWVPQPIRRGGNTFHVDPPAHSATMVFCAAPTALMRKVNFVLGVPNVAPDDGADNVLDAADLR